MIDVCVNGPYNYMGDGDAGQWVATFQAARKLGASVVRTGHGPRATGAVLGDQQAFFKALIAEVEKRMVHASPGEARAQVGPGRTTHGRTAWRSADGNGERHRRTIRQALPRDRAPGG